MFDSCTGKLKSHEINRLYPGMSPPYRRPILIYLLFNIKKFDALSMCIEDVSQRIRCDSTKNLENPCFIAL